MLNFFGNTLSSLSNLSPLRCLYNQLRTRTSCSKIDGKEKSVKTAMKRYFRIDKRLWIKSQPGYKHHLYLKPLEKRFIQQQPVIVGKKESKMLERMAGKYYKSIKLEQFVDEPFTYYHPYLKKKKFEVFP